MIKTYYWPEKQSLKLNLAVANLFIQIYQNLSYPVSNKTNNLLAIDLLDPYIQQYLLTEILIELEILILDITEANMSIYYFNIFKKQIIDDLLERIKYKFFLKFTNISKQNLIAKPYKYINISNDTKLTLSILLTYLIYGSSYLKKQFFLFFNSSTPVYHVKLLFEHIIIDIGNTITLQIIKYQPSIYDLYNFLIHNHLANIKYSSLRSLTNFQNSLGSNTYLYKQIEYPAQIYNCICKIYFLEQGTVFNRNIYLYRACQYKEISNLQIVVILLLELQDFILPKINYLITLLGKFIIFIIYNIIHKSIIYITNVLIRNMIYTKNRTL